MDVNVDYETYRQLLGRFIQSRREEGRQKDWVVECYDSKETFEKNFPEPQERERLLRTIRCSFELCKVTIDAAQPELERMAEEGLSYVEKEQLRSEMKEPNRQAGDSESDFGI